MPRFYFEVNDGRQRTDDEIGVYCANLDELRKMAQRELALIFRDEMPDGGRGTFVVLVRDETGVPVYIATASLLTEMLGRRE
ncbi:hypothetical protein [Maritimibacter sp. DP1N21-5]|uniref:DUF6894 family protein n=1 Tax=Maritimibacter sp. DP1N21-5 TaxID=2836867 RepID=UPI001C468768|nr:hypothetical protein [Maritimibacter sp. DP1N21-5]MBV7410083.1 hypothetical protein [Maritimibacter sp. DP1N21-5]